MDIVDRLVELVAVPSVSGDEKVITDQIEAMVRRLRPEWPIQRLGNNLVVGPVRGGDGERPLVGLVGHTDTVPAQGNAVPEVRDDHVWGVGSSDMKAGVAVMCDLVETLPEGERPYDLLFVFYDKEEIGFDENGLGRVLEDIPVVKTIDFAFVLEGTEGYVELGCNGHLVVEVAFDGRSAHSARPWMGENAIHKAVGLFERIASFEMKEIEVGPVTYRETLQITKAQGGIARNVVPDSFVVMLSYRFPPGRTVDEAIAYMRSLAPEGAEVRVHDISPPGAIPRDNPIYDAFRAHANPRLRSKQGWTDVARLTMNGVDAVNYGPGVPELCHRADERCPIRHLREVREVLGGFLTGKTGKTGKA